MAKDNTVQYQQSGAPSYAGARVEVQERLDGRLLVRHREQTLTPQEAPALGTAGPVGVPRRSKPERAQSR